MGFRGWTQGFIGQQVGVQIKPLGRVRSPRNAPISFKRGDVLPHLVP